MLRRTVLIIVLMLLLLSLIFGFIIVERNVRRVAFNDYSNLIFLINSDKAHQLWIKFMGSNYIIDFKRIKIYRKKY